MTAAARHVVCPHCGAVNRIPSGRQASQAKCGRCHRAVFEGKPLPVDAAGFDRHRTRNDIPVVVDFWASWCGPCKAMAPAYERAAAELEPDVRLLKVDTEKVQDVAVRYDVRSIPTLMVFVAGEPVARIAGAMGTKDIVGWVREHARPPRGVGEAA